MGKSNEVGAIPYEKSNNVESSLFQMRGRIARKCFWFRTFLCVLLWVAAHIAFIYWETPNYNEWKTRGGGKIQDGAVQIEMRHKVVKNIDYYILPIFLLAFVVIQAVKRAHDCNRSGKYLIIPFYNIYLMLAKGSPNDNDYGLLPHVEVKSPSYKCGETT